MWEWECKICVRYIGEKKRLHMVYAPKLIALIIREITLMGRFKQELKVYKDHNSTRDVTRLYMIKCQGSNTNNMNAELRHGMNDKCGLE
jgi:ubiquitin C-terminal hydrolase